MSRRSKSGRQLHGILLLDKATGGSSNHALQRVKRIYNAQKAGHTGSLDPLATGMLPVCFGEATKVSAFLLDADKTYQTDARLGIRTNSGDVDGEIIETLPLPANLSRDLVEQAVERFIGPQDQIPPMFSAIKIDGQRLYKLARKGLTVERQARRITVHSIDILAWEKDLLSLQVRCSKGTYIRTLVEDIGAALGCGAHVEGLRRISVSPFENYPMVTQNELDGWLETDGMEKLDSLLLAPDQALPGMPRFDISIGLAAIFCQGQSVPQSLSQGRTENLSGDNPSNHLRVYCQDELLGIARSVPGDTGQMLIRPYRVFNWQGT